MRWIDGLQRRLERSLEVLVVVSLVGLVAVMAGQVVLRYLLRSSFLGVEEVSALCGLWLYFTGMALVTAQGGHIRGGFLFQRLKPSGRRLLQRLFGFTCAAICVYFLILGAEYVRFVAEHNRRSTFLRWPSFVWAGSLCFGLGLSALLFFLRGLRPPAEQ